MKNIVNRALVAKKKQFLSKAVPRGTRTIWRYLGALFILFTFAIGNVWGDESISWAITTNTLNLTPTITPATDAHLSNASNTISLTGFTQTSSSKTGYAKPFYNTVADFDASNKFASVSFDIEDGYTFTPASLDLTVFSYGSGNYKYKVIISDTEGNSLTSNEIKPSSGSEASISFDDISEVTFEGTVTIKLYAYNYNSNSSGKRIYIKSPIAISGSIDVKGGGTTTTYDVTLNPGDGAYASAPSGWTVDGSNIKKTVSAGALTIPEPTRAGYKVTGWKAGLVDVALSAGKLTVSKDTSLTAQWAEAECKIYSLTGEIGSAAGTAGDYEVTASALILKNSNARIKLTPAGGETFKAGDVITISGFTGNATKKLGVYVKNAAGSSNIATAEEANLGDGFASATLSADAEYVFLARKEGTTMNVLTCEVHRACAEGTAAGLGYAEAEVNKTEGDAAFTNPLTNANSLVVAGYSSSNTAVATVATNGQVTVVGPGSATITANSAVQTKAGTLYAAGSASYTLTVAALPKYTVTYDLNGGSGSPSEVDHKAGEKFNLHDGVTGITAPTNKTFVNWKDQDDALFDGGAEYTMPAKNVTLTAQWAGDVYTVKYMDGEDLLDTKVVEVGSHPADIEHPTKPLYTFAAWQLSGSDVVLDDVSGAKDAVVTLTARWAKVYASSYDMEAYAASDGASKSGLETALTAAGYAYTNINGIDNGHTHNYTYDGMKYKTNDGDLSFNVVAGKVVEVKTGHLPSNDAVTMYINGVADATVFEGADEEQETHKINYFYSAAEALYRLDVQASKGTCAVKAVTIRDPFTVSFDANGGENVASLNGTPSIILPSAEKGTESFLGWFTETTGGEKIGDAGESYTPSADITLHAQWEAISTDNTLSDLKVGGETVDGFSPTVHTYYVVLPYGTKPENIPAITATANSAKAKQVAIQQAVWTDTPYNCYRAQANVQAEDESWGYYDVRFSFAPKDGVSIIKVATTGGTNKTVTGVYAGDGDVSLSSNTKMDKNKYIGFSLDGTTLQAGDKINVHTSTAANTGGSHIIFYDNMTDKNELYDTEEIGGLGDNIFTINAAMVGATTAYVYRSNADNAHKWNGCVDYIEVLRAMNPILTAITLDGVAAEKGTGNAFSATLPNGTNLASMTVVPTVIWNGAGTTAPTAAWAWGANTYRVTDKDGDYTDYTITLTEAAAPSAAPVITAQPASANYYEGAAIAALEVVATGESLTYQWYLGDDAIDGATEATYTPAVSAIGSYVYHCVVTNTEVGHPATSLASDDATITIAEDPAAIKLLDGEGNVNTTDFITAVSKNTVNYGGADHNCATFGSTASTAVGASGLNKFIIYNAKTDQTKIKFVLYNTQNGAVTMKLQKLVEGGTEMVEEVINVPSKEEFTTDFYTFNGSANRTMYAFVQNTGIKVLQVKVIDNGTALKQFGEVGYSINFNQGRLFLNSGTDGAYDGLTYNAASNFAPLSSTGLSLTKNKAYRFNVPAAATMTVTAANNAKYYITQTEDGEDNETAVAAATSFDLTAGTWYLRVAGSNLGVTNIAFATPKCAEPVIDADPESNTNFGPGNLTASVTAHATDGATLAYQWYDADDNEVAGATEATLTTTTEGTYYVIITASKAGYDDRSVQSANATLGYRDFTIATLSALSYGGTAITLEADKYEYRVDLAENTTVVPALAATATQAAYGATAVPTDATEFDNYEAVSTVLVTAEDGVTTQTYTVHFYVDHIYTALVDVTESTTWNWTGSDDVTINDVANKGLILANYIDGLNFEKIEGKEGERARRNQNGGCYQGTQLHFNTTVPGKVKFYFRAPSGDEKCTIYVNNNGKRIKVGTRGNSLGWSKEVIVKGDVVIEMENDKAGGGDTRVQQIVFTQVAPDYTRNVTNNIGTLCVDHNVLAGGALGATFYQIASRNEIYNDKIDFEEVLPNEELKAGEPYIFQSTTGKIELFYGETVADEPVAVRGMYGNFAAGHLDIDDDNKLDILYIAKNKLWNCEDLVESGLILNDHRAYIKMSEVPTYAEAHSNPNGAPRRRVTIGGDAPAVTTGIENGGLINGENGVQKVLINGQIFILLGEKMYDATGRLVK